MPAARIRWIFLACSALWGSPAFCADVCAAAGAAAAHGEIGGIAWTSYTRQLPRGKVCIGSSLAGTGRVEWVAAGIQQASVRGSLDIQLCCFDAEESSEGEMRVGDEAGRARAHRPAEEGAAGHKEGFPDLMEEDARIVTIAIRGELEGGAKVDLVLKCSASRFAQQYAYQFVVTNRSSTGVALRWNLLDELGQRLKPSVQTLGPTRTSVFLTGTAPTEAESVLEISSLDGKVVGNFNAPGFTTEINSH